MNGTFDLVCLVLPALVALGAGWGAHRRGQSKPFGAQCFFFWYVVIGVGAAGLIDGLSQVFAGQQTASLNQWPNSPFVIELGFMSCAFGLLGILSIWVRGTWRQATAVGYGVFLLLAALYHVYDAAANRTTRPATLGQPSGWM